jgi:hypothetical protein
MPAQRSNREYQAMVCNRLTEHLRQRLEALLTRAEDETKSPWNLLKNEPKQPTSQNNKDFLQHLEWLRE